MKKSLIGLVAGVGAAASLLGAPVASAHEHVNLSLNFGLPSVAYPAAPSYGTPIYGEPQVVYQRPPPVYVTPAPVYYSAPPSVYVPPAPVYYYGYPPVRYWNHGPHFYHHEHRHHWR